MNREEWDKAMKERDKVKKEVGMPSTSKKQQAATAIAKHHPEKLFKRNKGLLKMSKNQLSEFASTPTKGLPKKASAKAKATVNTRVKKSSTTSVGKSGIVPGSKARSGGKGRGLMTGRGKGPIGVPVGAKATAGPKKKKVNMKATERRESIGDFIKRRNKEKARRPW